MGRPKKIETTETTKSEVGLKRKEILSNLMRSINKNTRNGAIKFACDEEIKGRVPFGIIELDKFIGGGIVRGNFSIIYGPSSAGKTSLAYHQIAQAQKQGLVCALFDLEHSFSPDRAKTFGVNIDELVLIANVNTAEEAMDILINLSKEQVIDFAVIDSIQALSPKGQQETKTGALKSVEDDTMALLARKMSQFLTMSKDYVYAGKVAVLLIGQVRTGGLGSYVVKATLSGGNAQKHYANLIGFLRRGQNADAPVEKYKEFYKDETGKDRYRTKDRAIGFDTCFKIEKHKMENCQPEGSEIHIPFYYETGFIQPTIKNEEEEKNERGSTEE